MGIAVNIEKIGNTLIYLIDKIGNLHLTKAIKLLYILDEISVKETGVPFSWLEYHVWKNGPVPVYIYDIIRQWKESGWKSELVNYIDVEITGNRLSENLESYRLISTNQFSDDEFSQYDLDLLDRVISLYGEKTSDQLIELLHQENTLWDRIVKKEELELQFRLRQFKSEYSIPFLEIIKSDPIKQSAYKAAYDSITSLI